MDIHLIEDSDIIGGVMLVVNQVQVVPSLSLDFVAPFLVLFYLLQKGILSLNAIFELNQSIVAGFDRPLEDTRYISLLLQFLPYNISLFYKRFQVLG
jgi:hypothetical protein